MNSTVDASPSIEKAAKPAVRRLRVLILNQAFYPDVVSTAQHASDLAVALAERGHQVTAISSRRAYDDPTSHHPGREIWNGIQIRRIWGTGLGKSSRWRRAVDFGSYLANCVWQVLIVPKHHVVVALTSPPLISFVAAVLVKLKGGRLVFWVMDLNPDEAIVAGWLNPASITAKLLSGMLNFSVRTSARIIALDRFMKERLASKGAREEQLVTLPPWSHNQAAFFDRKRRAEFRDKYGIQNSFVVMYSGNHSPCHPLSTLMAAAEALRERRDIVFAFIGGGSEYGMVRRFAAEHSLQNCLFLPYQPLDQLSGSLSAADLHVVVMGNEFVGIVHPCKIYNILSLGTPVLYIGPGQSHITDIEPPTGSGWLRWAAHGDVGAATRGILDAHHDANLEVKEEMRMAEQFSQDNLIRLHVDAIEAAAI